MMGRKEHERSEAMEALKERVAAQEIDKAVEATLKTRQNDFAIAEIDKKIKELEKTFEQVNKQLTASQQQVTALLAAQERLRGGHEILQTLKQSLSPKPEPPKVKPDWIENDGKPTAND